MVHFIRAVALFFSVAVAMPAAAGDTVVVPPMKPRPVVNLRCDAGRDVIPMRIQASDTSPGDVAVPAIWPPIAVTSCMFEVQSKKASFTTLRLMVGSFCQVTRYETAVRPNGANVLVGDCTPQFWTGPEPVPVK
jgi:hypothetical protein